MTNTDVPGGAHPTPPDAVTFATVTEDGEVLGSLWMANTPVPGRVNSGATTHHHQMPPRLAWLAQGIAIGLDRGMTTADVWAEIKALCGTRWTLGTMTEAPTIQEARYMAAEVALAPKTKPTKKANKTKQEDPA